jgi:cyanophycin synthetase
VRDGRITLASGRDEIRVCRLGDVPVIGKQKDPATIANVLAAVAAGWALGLTQEVIGTGVKTFGLELPDPAALLPQRAGKSPAATARN